MTTPSRTGFNSLNASAGNLSSAATVPANTNLAVAFWSHWDGNGGSSASGLSINGVALTIRSQLAEGAATDEAGIGVATLVNPAIGSQTHALTWSAGGARTEGGAVVFVYYQDANTGDPVRASGVNAAIETSNPTVALASTETTDMVVGYAERFSDSGENPAITGVTAFINNTVVNGHVYDVGEDTGLSGTVTIGNTGLFYSCAAGISLKASEAAAAGGFRSRIAGGFVMVG